MKKYIIPLLISALCLMLLMNSTSNVYAWGPISHAGMISEAIDQCNKNSIAYQLISTNDKWFWEGVMFPDITVLHYYTTFKSYQDTHTWSFYTTLWAKASIAGSNQAKAFALGVGTHLLQDAIVHNSYIPEKIKQYFTQNAIVHPLVEAQIEGKFATIGADWYSLQSTTKVKDSFQKILIDQFEDSPDLSNENAAEFAIRCLGIDKGTDTWSTYMNDTAIFRDILYGETFYSEQGYSTSGQLWGMYKAGGAIIQNFVNIGDVQKYKDQTINQTAAWYNSNFYEKDVDKNFVPTAEKDPTGINSINAANSYVMTWYIFGFICFAVIIIIWSYRRKIFSSPKLKLAF